MAANSGMSYSNVYGCTDVMSVGGGAAKCSGKWVDGNGRDVSPATATRYNLTTYRR
jgi:hypothetical protein